MMDNNSSSSEEGHQPTTFSIIFATAICILDVAGSIGNILVLVAFTRDTKTRLERHCYVANLAIVDLCIGLFSVPFYLPNLLLHRWPFSKAFCVVWTSVDFTLCSVSVYSIILITYDRYSLVRDVHGYFSVQSIKRALRRIAFIWILAFLTRVPFTLFGTWWISRETDEIPCDPNAPYDVPNKIGYKPYDIAYTLTVYTLEFYLPVVVLLGWNIKVYKYVKGRISKVHSVQVIAHVNGQGHLTGQSIVPNSDVHRVTTHTLGKGAQIFVISANTSRTESPSPEEELHPESCQRNGFSLSPSYHTCHPGLLDSMNLRFKRLSVSNLNSHGATSVQKSTSEEQRSRRYSCPVRCMDSKTTGSTDDDVVETGPVMQALAEQGWIASQEKIPSQTQAGGSVITNNDATSGKEENIALTPASKGGNDLLGSENVISKGESSSSESDNVTTGQSTDGDFVAFGETEAITSVVEQENNTSNNEERQHVENPSQRTTAEQKTRVLVMHKFVRYRKTLVTVTFLVMLFIIFKGPYSIVVTINAFCDDFCIPDLLYEAATWMVWIKSFLNPFLYAFLSVEFRQICKKYIHCRRCHHNSQVADCIVK